MTRRIRQGLLRQLDALTGAPVGHGGITVRDGLSDTGATLYEDLQARLRTRGLTNERIAAETLRPLEEIEASRQTRRLRERRAELEDQELMLRNIREAVSLLGDMEPSAAAELNAAFVQANLPVPRLPLPRRGD